MTTMTNKLILGGVVLAALAVVGWFLPVTHPVTQQVVQQLSGTPGPALTTLDGCIDINGVQKCAFRQNFRQMASTTCAFKTPANASSTVKVGVNVRQASSTQATVVEIGSATDPFSTTTKLGSTFTIPSNGAYNWVSSSTETVGIGQLAIFKGGTNINVKIGGGITTGDTVGTGFVPLGSCWMETTSF